MKNEVIVKIYSEEFKKKVADEVSKGSLSLRGAQMKYGIGKTETIRRWQLKYGKNVPVVKYHYVTIDKPGGNIIERQEG